MHEPDLPDVSRDLEASFRNLYAYVAEHPNDVALVEWDIKGIQRKIGKYWTVGADIRHYPSLQKRGINWSGGTMYQVWGTDWEKPFSLGFVKVPIDKRHPLPFEEEQYWMDQLRKAREAVAKEMTL